MIDKEEKMKQLAYFLSIIFVAFCVINCSSYEKEKNVALNSSNAFYKKFVNGKTNDFNGYLVSISTPVQIYEKEESNLKFQENLKERLTLLSEIFKKIEKRELQEVKTETFENGVKVSTKYALKTLGGNFYQTIVWKINEDKPKLLNVITYSYNNNEEVQVVVKDGKIIL